MGSADLKRLADERRDAQRRLAEAGLESGSEPRMSSTSLRLRRREHRAVLEDDLNGLDRRSRRRRGASTYSNAKGASGAEAAVAGVSDGCGAVGHAKLGEDVRDVVADGFVAQVQPFGDGGVG